MERSNLEKMLAAIDPNNLGSETCPRCVESASYLALWQRHIQSWAALMDKNFAEIREIKVKAQSLQNENESLRLELEKLGGHSKPRNPAVQQTGKDASESTKDL